MSKVFFYHYRMKPGLKLEPRCWLSEDELRRFSEMKNARRQQEFLQSRFVLQSVMQKHFGKKSVVILQKPQGKPYVRGLKFNLSHSSDQIVLAVHPKFEIGVDIETAKDKKFYREITEQYFSKTEAQYIFSGLSRLQQMKKFRNIWSLKEAFVKAMDGVLNQRVLKISFDLPRKLIEHSPVQKLTCFHNEKLNTAICVRGLIPSKSLQTFDITVTASGELVIKACKTADWECLISPRA